MVAPAAKDNMQQRCSRWPSAVITGGILIPDCMFKCVPSSDHEPEMRETLERRR